MKKKYLASALLFIILIMITYTFLLKDNNPLILLETLKKSSPIFVSLAFLSLGCSVFFESLFLKRMFFHLGYRISFYHAIGYVATEIYFSAITPSSMGGQPVQMIEMKKDNIGYQTTSVIVLLNTMIYKIALIVLAIFAFICCYPLVFSRSAFFNWVVLLGFLTTVFVILLFGIVIYSKRFVNFLLKKVCSFIQHSKWITKKEEWQTKVRTSIQEYQECAKFTKQHPKVLLESFGILLCQRLSLLGISFLIYKSFGLNEYNLFQVIAFQICITLGSDLMPTPGGVMISEGLLLEANNLLFGESLALSGMLLQRTISFYILVVLSGIWYMIFHFKKRKRAVKR